MASDDTNTPAISVVPPIDVPREPSVVDLIRAELEELQAVEDVDIPVRGYEKSGLAIKYRLPENGKELDIIGRKVQREAKDAYTRNLLTAIDTMIALCVGFYVEPPEVDTPVELDPEETGMPVRFDPRLASILGMKNIETTTARQVVRKLFDNNELAILAHADKLGRWLTDTKADLTVEVWQLGG